MKLESLPGLRGRRRERSIRQAAETRPNDEDLVSGKVLTAVCRANDVLWSHIKPLSEGQQVEQFECVARDGIPYSSWREFLKTLGLKVSPTVSLCLFYRYDTTTVGCIELADLIREMKKDHSAKQQSLKYFLYTELGKPEVQKNLERQWAKQDKIGKGWLSLDGFAKVVEAIVGKQDANEVRRVFMAIDTEDAKQVSVSQMQDILNPLYNTEAWRKVHILANAVDKQKMIENRKVAMLGEIADSQQSLAKLDQRARALRMEKLDASPERRLEVEKEESGIARMMMETQPEEHEVYIKYSTMYPILLTTEEQGALRNVKAIEKASGAPLYLRRSSEMMSKTRAKQEQFHEATSRLVQLIRDQKDMKRDFNYNNNQIKKLVAVGSLEPDIWFMLMSRQATIYASFKENSAEIEKAIANAKDVVEDKMLTKEDEQLLMDTGELEALKVSQADQVLAKSLLGSSRDSLEQDFRDAIQRLRDMATAKHDEQSLLQTLYTQLGGGPLDLNAWIKAMTVFGISAKEDVLHALFHRYDETESGTISYETLVKGLNIDRENQVSMLDEALRVLFARCVAIGNMRTLFDHYDLNEDAHLSSSELVALCMELLEYSDAWTTKEIEEWIETVGEVWKPTISFKALMSHFGLLYKEGKLAKRSLMLQQQELDGAAEKVRECRIAMDQAILDLNKVTEKKKQSSKRRAAALQANVYKLTAAYQQALHEERELEAKWSSTVPLGIDSPKPHTSSPKKEWDSHLDADAVEFFKTQHLPMLVDAKRLTTIRLNRLHLQKEKAEAKIDEEEDTYDALIEIRENIQRQEEMARNIDTLLMKYHVCELSAMDLQMSSAIDAYTLMARKELRLAKAEEEADTMASMALIPEEAQLLDDALMQDILSQEDNDSDCEDLLCHEEIMEKLQALAKDIRLGLQRLALEVQESTAGKAAPHTSVKNQLANLRRTIKSNQGRLLDVQALLAKGEGTDPFTPRSAELAMDILQNAQPSQRNHSISHPLTFKNEAPPIMHFSESLQPASTQDSVPPHRAGGSFSESTKRGSFGEPMNALPPFKNPSPTTGSTKSAEQRLNLLRNYVLTTPWVENKAKANGKRKSQASLGSRSLSSDSKAPIDQGPNTRVLTVLNRSHEVRDIQSEVKVLDDYFADVTPQLNVSPTSPTQNRGPATRSLAQQGLADLLVKAAGDTLSYAHKDKGQMLEDGWDPTVQVQGDALPVMESTSVMSLNKRPGSSATRHSRMSGAKKLLALHEPKSLLPRARKEKVAAVARRKAERYISASLGGLTHGLGNQSTMGGLFSQPTGQLNRKAKQLYEIQDQARRPMKTKEEMLLWKLRLQQSYSCQKIKDALNKTV